MIIGYLLIVLAQPNTHYSAMAMSRWDTLEQCEAARSTIIKHWYRAGSWARGAIEPDEVECLEVKE